MKLCFEIPLVILAGVCLSVGAVSAQQPESAPPTVPSGPPTGSSPAPADKAEKDGSVWGALVYASNTPLTNASSDEPAEFPNLHKRLSSVFPYKSFQVLGQHNQVVFREYESWVVPSRDVFLKLDSKGAATGGGLNLHVQFWRGQQVLVKTDVLLLAGNPLIIGGPKWRDGQLVFLLDLKKN